jgi:LysR family transcriptional activator of nhaA
MDNSGMTPWKNRYMVFALMEWLNYHHLLYFWIVAREGSVTRAAAELRLGQPTISAQIRTLEESLGEKLFTRVGRNLALTDVGRLVFRFADEIFSLGRELLDTLKDRPTGRPLRFSVGIADVVPKLIAYRLLQPAFDVGEPVRVICREDKPDRLLAELAVYGLDLVLADAPLGSTVKVRAFNHLLGECGLTFFGTRRLARAYRRGFPRSLAGAPLLLPTDNTALRRSLEQWFDAEGIRPLVIGEFEDSALLNVFGRAGLGIFPAPSAIEKATRQQYGVEPIGRIDAVQARFYAISVERRLKHPAVVAIVEAARRRVFG